MKMFILAHSCRKRIVHISQGEVECFLTCRHLSVEVVKRTAKTGETEIV